MTIEMSIEHLSEAGDAWPVPQRTGLSTWRGRSFTLGSSVVSTSGFSNPSASTPNGREALLTDAALRFSQLASADQGLIGPAERALLALGYLLFDGAPRPQIDRAPSGGLETEWLVNGRSVILLNSRGGDDALWALSSNKQIEFRGRFNIHAMSGDLLVARAQRALREQAEDLKNTRL